MSKNQGSNLTVRNVEIQIDGAWINLDEYLKGTRQFMSESSTLIGKLAGALEEATEWIERKPGYETTFQAEAREAVIRKARAALKAVKESSRT